MGSDLLDKIEERPPPGPFRVVCWVIGCLVWAFLAQMAFRPDLSSATASLADDLNGSWSIWVLRAATPLVIGIALARRYHTWPTVATLSTIGAAVIGVNVGIVGILEFGFTSECFIHCPNEQTFEHPGLLVEARPSAIGILLALVIAAVVATVVWWAVSGLLWLGMFVRRGVQQLMTRVG